MNKPVINIKNLNVDYITDKNPIKAVRDVTFEIFSGEIFGLVGESGSGKSTVVQAMMRILPTPAIISKGEVIINNEDILASSSLDVIGMRWKKISIVMQSALNALNPVLSIREQIHDVLKTHKNLIGLDADERAKELLSLVEIDHDRLDSFPHQLSGGMKQRIVIAIALAIMPPIIIMDEPTTALDVIVEREIIAKIIDLRKKLGFTILFITHDLNIVKKFSDDICVMKDGKIVESGRVNEIFANPQHPYTIKLLNSIPGSKEKFNSDANILLNAEKVNVNYPILKNVFGQVKEYLNAVKTVDIKIYSGSTTGLVGESGSGKSSLARALLGIENAQGSIYFDGKDINLLSSSEKRNFKKDFQIVFQDPFGSLSPRMTIGEIVGEGLKVHDPNLGKSERIQRIQKALSDVELESSFMARFPHELSGGQRQRVAIARAIILEPKLILLDEPTSALDVSIQMQVLELLKDLQSRLGLAYLCISHDLKVIRYLSDYVYVMKDGSIVENGLSKNLFDSPKHPYTQELLAASLV